MWVALWVVLVLGAVVVLGLLGRSVYRKSRLLLRESADVAERFAAIAEGLEQLADQNSDPDLAVFADPGALRRDRALAAKARSGRRSSARHRAADPRQRPGRPRRERTT